MAAECSGDLNEVIPNVSDKKYRFFTLPIEQIPGYKEDKPQILVHRPGNGLQWFTLDKCLPVVTCLDLQTDTLKVERRSIIVIKDFEIPDDTECDIDLINCESET